MYTPSPTMFAVSEVLKRATLFYLVRRLTLILLLGVGLPATIQAQSVWLSPAPTQNVTLEAHKPLYANMEGVTLLTSAWQLSARYGVMERVQVVGEVGLAHFGQDVVGDVLQDFSETAISNVFLGVTVYPAIDGLRITLGGRLPTVSEAVEGGPGVFADPYRYEAFIIDYATLLAEGAYLLPINETVSVQIVGRPAVHFDVGEVDRGGTDFSMRYALQGWYDADQFRGGVGVTGSASLITGLHMGLYDSNVLAVTTSLIGKLDNVEPGIIVQIPFTDAYSEMVDAVVGLSLTVPLQ